MSNEELQNRMTELEIRLSHQELALESLTQQSLSQTQTIEVLQKQIEHLKSMVKELTPSPLAPEDAETPPPHY